MRGIVYGRGNRVVGRGVLTFSLPAGWTCPGAVACLAKADRATGKVWDGPAQRFRCYAAMDERYPGVRRARWHNFELLERARKAGGAAAMARELLGPLPQRAQRVRISVAGDMYCRDLVRAWFLVAAARPRVMFYGYTTSLHHLAAVLAERPMPWNLVFNASAGGRFDDLLPTLRRAHVVADAAEAAARGLSIDADDLTAAAPIGRGDFALLLHGSQPRRGVEPA